MGEAEDIDQLNFPDDLKYTETSEWVKLEGDQARVGITDFAQHELTDIVYVEAPAVGSTVTKGEEFGVVESVKAAADFYAPVSGEIIEVNEELNDSPNLMNSEPYGAGWMVIIKMSNPEELEQLFDKAAYVEHIKQEKAGH
ncbi:glycine cleavage system protein GcvH [[Eubacterium] cellulosolvens]